MKIDHLTNDEKDKLCEFLQGLKEQSKKNRLEIKRVFQFMIDNCIEHMDEDDIQLSMSIINEDIK